MKVKCNGSNSSHRQDFPRSSSTSLLKPSRPADIWLHLQRAAGFGADHSTPPPYGRACRSRRPGHGECATGARLGCQHAVTGPSATLCGALITRPCRVRAAAHRTVIERPRRPATAGNRGRGGAGRGTAVVIGEGLLTSVRDAVVPGCVGGDRYAVGIGLNSERALKTLERVLSRSSSFIIFTSQLTMVRGP